MSDDSAFIAKEPCPECGSRDNLGRYSDGHAYCFGCGHYEPATDAPPHKKERTRMAAGLITGGEFKALTSRGITEETCRKFGYTVAHTQSGKVVQVAPYYDAQGNIVAQKVRPKNKDEMFMTGDAKDVLLFGQQLWGSGGRKVVVTEGEIDAMSVSQAQGNKWPVVSIPKGAKAARKELAKHVEWLCTFEEVVLMFDMDEPGREASVECATLFPPGKCKLASLPMKDPNELLQAGKADLIVNAIWQAKPYRPDGIVTLDDIWEDILKDPEMGLSWWLPSLTKYTYGRRLGETYAFGAGTGVGKTDFFTQQMQHDISVLNERIGVFALEQLPKETAKRLAGKLAGKRFHVPDNTWTKDELKATLTELRASGKVFFYDSWGATEWDVVKGAIRFLAHSEGVKLFYLDHLTALASGTASEVSAVLEGVMAEMAKLAKELNVIIHFVSHLNTPDGTPHEEGGRVMIRHFKGSRAIGFWSHFMFGIERDQQNEDEAKRMVTTFRVLKDRYTGDATGKLIYLGYDTAVGKLYETEAPKEEGSGFKDETTKSDF